MQGGFTGEGTHLQRYATRFTCAEINSSFHRPHRPSTYAKWADAVPRDFRFAVKVPKTITHERKLVEVEPLLDSFLAEVAGLDGKLAALLVQLPPKLAFDATVADRFLALMRDRFVGTIVLEPRHATWFDTDASTLLAARRIARVAADPARVPAAADPGGHEGVVYYRLHGSPRTYYSSYDEAYLDVLAAKLSDAARRADEVWCIFDNTASGAAAGNALALLERLAASVTPRA